MGCTQLELFKRFPTPQLVFAGWLVHEPCPHGPTKWTVKKPCDVKIVGFEYNKTADSNESIKQDGQK